MQLAIVTSRRFVSSKPPLQMLFDVGGGGRVNMTQNTDERLNIDDDNIPRTACPQLCVHVAKQQAELKIILGSCSYFR